MDNNSQLKELVFGKSTLKQNVYRTTKEVFEMFREQSRTLVDEFRQCGRDEGRDVAFDFTDRGDFEFELKFGGDILLFMMHTNVFEFSRDHQVMKSSYIREDAQRSYCGVIHIYNFLADSFLYQRDNDLGYLIGRLFVNKERHYFIEGKRELGMLYTNFGNALIDSDAVRQVVESAIEYTTNFDLLTPPFDEVKVVSVGEMRYNLDKKSLVTGKRLGFRFQADN
ncbi:MAG: hypothetical protein IJ760_07495 [Bacteroidales bacterium]|nr:hypothetical protein [Bacteroidales bacterium]